MAGGRLLCTTPLRMSWNLRIPKPELRTATVKHCSSLGRLFLCDTKLEDSALVDNHFVVVYIGT